MASDSRGVTGSNFIHVSPLPKENPSMATNLKIAMINAAAKLAAVKIAAIGEDYNAKNDFFSTEFERISKVIQDQGW